MKKWEKCCEEQPTIDPETGRCQNGCGPKQSHPEPSPLPWHHSYRDWDDSDTICTTDGRAIAVRPRYTTSDDFKVDAEIIVKAVNSYAAHLALIDELTSIVDDMDYVLTNVWKPDYKKFHDQFSERCKKALARSRQVMEGKK